jgi:hypothetical protein
VVRARAELLERGARGGDVGDSGGHGAEHGRVARTRHALDELELPRAGRRLRGQRVHGRLLRVGMRAST